jgi:cysteine desulfurase
MLFGGAHENERRAGTENLAAIIGMTESLNKYGPFPAFPKEKLHSLTSKIAAALSKIAAVQVVGDQQCRLSNTLAFVVRASDSISLLAALDLEGICASSGSACSAGSLNPSHVISALGFDKSLANSLIRFSLGRENTDQEVDFLITLLPEIIRRSQPS